MTMDTAENSLVGIPEWNRGDRLRKAREAAGYARQADFAQALNVDRTTISNAERGARHPIRSVMARWAEITGVPLWWLEHGELRQHDVPVDLDQRRTERDGSPAPKGGGTGPKQRKHETSWSPARRQNLRRTG